VNDLSKLSREHAIISVQDLQNCTGYTLHASVQRLRAIDMPGLANQDIIGMQLSILEDTRKRILMDSAVAV
jgi:hypothetical protein